MARALLVSIVVFGAGCAEAPTAPTEFAPGQIWRDRGATQEDAVEFAVVGLGSVEEFGELVAVRISGDPAHAMDRLGTNDALPDQWSSIHVYRRSLLWRHANEFVTTVPGDLLDPWNCKEWYSSLWRPSPSVETLAPSILIRGRKSIAKEYRLLESKLPAYLPRDSATKHEGPRVEVSIAVRDRGTSRSLTYVVDGERCLNLTKLSTAIQACKERHGEETIVRITPLKNVTLDDVSAVFVAILDVWKATIEVGDGPASNGEPRLSTIPLRVGQVWTYGDEVAGERQPTITVLHVVEVPGQGEIAFIRFDGVPPVDGKFQIATDWVPYWARSVRRW